MARDSGDLLLGDRAIVARLRHRLPRFELDSACARSRHLRLRRSPLPRRRLVGAEVAFARHDAADHTGHLRRVRSERAQPRRSARSRVLVGTGGPDRGDVARPLAGDEGDRSRQRGPGGTRRAPPRRSRAGHRLRNRTGGSVGALEGRRRAGQVGWESPRRRNDRRWCGGIRRVDVDRRIEAGRPFGG